MDNASHLKEFQGRVKTVETYGGTFGQEPRLIKKQLSTAADPNNPTEQEQALAIKKVSNAIQAVLFISGSDSKRYSKLKNTLKEDYAKGHNNYPTTLPQALNLLNIHESTLPRSYGKPKQEEGVAFVQTSKESDKDKTGKCYHCGQPGHWKQNCPLKKYEAGVANINIEDEDEDKADATAEEEAVGLIQCAFIQQYRSKVNPNHIYLDTCAMFSQVLKEELIQNMKYTNQGLIAYCNTGTTFIKKYGYLGKLKVWFNAMGLTNIILFQELEKFHDISYGTKSTGGNFIVHMKHGDITFRKNEIGLPYLDLTADNRHLCLLLTVRENLQGFTKRQIN